MPWGKATSAGSSLCPTLAAGATGRKLVWCCVPTEGAGEEPFGGN